MENLRFYLGSDVYVELCYGEIKLVTSNGANKIYLDYGMFDVLARKIQEYKTRT